MTFLLFLLFAAGTLLGAGTVIFARNPMVAVVGMIFSFLNAAGLFIVLQAEFIGLLVIMVYVGAIAVMFLFVLMTTDIDFALLRGKLTAMLPAGLLVAAVLLAEFTLAILNTPAKITAPENPDAPENIVALGNILFTQYALPFQISGLVLLTAMVGAIVLTHRKRNGAKKQNISAQIARKREDAMVLTTPKAGQGATAAYWNPKPVDATPAPQSTKKKKKA